MATQWSLNGTYFEACNCTVACPCVLLGAPTEGNCTALVAWHIDQGKFGEVALDGLNMALMVHAPGHMMQVKWKAAVYADERATREQQDALLQIFSGQAGGHPALMATFIEEVLGVKTVPIDYQAEGKHRSVRIADIAAVDIEALEGQSGAEVTLHNFPFGVVLDEPAVIAKSSQLHFHDHGFALEISDRNGFYSPFTYRSS